MAERDVLRCRVTENPCGTDTWLLGHECQCGPCQTWVELRSLRETVERLTRERDGLIETAQLCSDNEQTFRARVAELDGLLEDSEAAVGANVGRCIKAEQARDAALARADTAEAELNRAVSLERRLLDVQAELLDRAEKAERERDEAVKAAARADSASMDAIAKTVECEVELTKFKRECERAASCLKSEVDRGICLRQSAESKLSRVDVLGSHACWAGRLLARLDAGKGQADG